MHQTNTNTTHTHTQTNTTTHIPIPTRNHRYIQTIITHTNERHTGIQTYGTHTHRDSQADTYRQTDRHKLQARIQRRKIKQINGHRDIDICTPIRAPQTYSRQRNLQTYTNRQ